MADLKAHEAGQESSTSNTASIHDSNKGPDAAIKASPEAEAAEDEVEYPKGMKLVVILAALLLTIFLVALDQTIISTAIPKITDQFHSIKDIGWYGSAYLLTATALQPTFGRVYTIFSVCLLASQPVTNHV